MKLIDKLEKLVSEVNLNPFKEDINLEEVVGLLYNHSEGDLLPAFMFIDKLQKEKQKKEINLMYQGLQDGMHQVSTLGKRLIENKPSEAKQYADYYFNDMIGDIATLINIAKAYFKNGTSKGASSYGWVKDFGHEDYINLVLEKNN